MRLKSREKSCLPPGLDKDAKERYMILIKGICPNNTETEDKDLKPLEYIIVKNLMSKFDESTNTTDVSTECVSGYEFKHLSACATDESDFWFKQFLNIYHKG